MNMILKYVTINDHDVDDDGNNNDDDEDDYEAVEVLPHSHQLL